MSDGIDWSSDILDEDVLDELERRFERFLKPRAVADGVELSDYKQIREWLRRRYEEGDPEVRDAMYLKALRHHFEDFHRPPYFWGCLVQVENLLQEGECRLMDDSALDDARTAMDEALADKAIEERVDIYSKRSIEAWVRRRYEDGDPLMRRALLSEAVWRAIHDFHLDFREAALPSCEEYFAEDHVMWDLWDRGVYDERPPVDEDEGPEDLEWSLESSRFIGRFTSSGNDYEVWDFEERDDLPPRFHLRRPRSPRHRDVCVGIYEPVYVDEGNGRIGLTEREMADFIDFLGRTTLYYYERHGYEMPDYTRLHWPEEG